MVLKLTFLKRTADTEKFKVVRALEHLVRLLDKVLRQGKGEVVSLLLLQRSLISPGLDLVEENIAGPTEPGCGQKIVELTGRVSKFIED